MRALGFTTALLGTIMVTWGFFEKFSSSVSGDGMPRTVYFLWLMTAIFASMWRPTPPQEFAEHRNERVWIRAAGDRAFARACVRWVAWYGAVAFTLNTWHFVALVELCGGGHGR